MGISVGCSEPSGREELLVRAKTNVGQIGGRAKVLERVDAFLLPPPLRVRCRSVQLAPATAPQPRTEVQWGAHDDAIMSFIVSRVRLNKSPQVV